MIIRKARRPDNEDTRTQFLAAVYDVRLNDPEAKSVLMCLAFYQADRENRGYPTIAQIMTFTEMSFDSVEYALKTLYATGITYPNGEIVFPLPRS